MGQSTFKFAAGKERNNLPKELQAKDLNLRTRKSKTFHYLLEQDRIQHKCNIEFFSIYIYILAVIFVTKSYLLVFNSFFIAKLI